MPDLLLELRSEEIPARMQRKAAGDLKKLVTDALVDAGLTYEGCREYWTPRRLTLDLRGLTARSADLREERKGPRADAPEKAIAGFLRGAGLDSVDQAEIRTDQKKGDFLVAVIEKPGRDAADIIAGVMPGIIENFPWPKSMRWGAASRAPGSLRWVRPLQSIVCLLGVENDETEVVPFEVAGIASGRTTYGHRFHAPDAITVRRFDDYVSKLEAACVVLDAERRKDIIRADAENLAFARGLDLVQDDGLLEEVANLVEWPVALLGEFGAEFLDIPAEVIRLTIKENQKCFVLRKQRSDALTNAFLLVSNIEASDGGAEIARGNAKVVNARLSDAKFFWETDLHTIREDGFDPWVKKLDNVTFHAKLGSQGDRVRRIMALARELAPLVGANPDDAERAAYIAKADLNSQMIYEFPELQGAMGRKYAQIAGEKPEAAAAAELHYSPLGPTDNVPTEPVSVAVALADKLDTLTGFWTIDEKPTGSKDPYALRRAALGVVRLVLENRFKIHLNEHAPDVLSFFHDRLKVFLRDSGARHDLIDAVLAPSPTSPLRGGPSGEAGRGGGPVSAVSDADSSPPPEADASTSPRGGGEAAANDDLLAITQRVEALGSFLDTDDGANLLAGTKRAANILVAEEKKGTAVADAVDSALFETDRERDLLKTIESAEHCAREALAEQNYEGAMKALAAMRAPVDAFFEDVMVNAEDDAVRANRLALMRRIRDATGTVADFSKIAG